MLYPHYRIWRRHQLREEDGILVGSDWNQEWLLPYWWENYQKYNRYPVAFVDFGMSQEKKKWCCERGEYISLQVGNVFVKEKDEVQEEIAARWERLGGGGMCGLIDTFGLKNRWLVFNLLFAIQYGSISIVRFSDH